MTIPAFHVEAKLHGFRRTSDGVVVSFVLHPTEVPQALALDPLGTRYMLALAQIGDDEQPVPPAGNLQPPDQERTTVAGKDRTPEPQTKPAGDLQRQRYAALSLPEQAVTRAALLARDGRFQTWANGCVGEDEAAQFIRKRCCDGNTRRLIAEVHEYRERFLAMELDFRIAVGEVAAPR